MPLLEERVADQPAAEAGQDGQRGEADRIEPLTAGHHTAEHGVGQHTGEIDCAEQVVQRRVRHRHSAEHSDRTRPGSHATRLHPAGVMRPAALTPQAAGAIVA
ncbi:MAG TPA: hypothetical protein VFH38_07265 [Jatrophihabitans sp.]|nr:hypothetical protein [Jatrophihabitans sp.]